MKDIDAHRRQYQQRIRFALDKQIPAIRFTLEIHTPYGPLCFDYKDAMRIANLAERLLKQQLKRSIASTAR